MLRARAETPGDKKTIASPVFADCRTRWGRDGGRGGARAAPIPPLRQHDGSALTGISPSVRTRDNPHRDVHRPPHVGTSYSSPMACAMDRNIVPFYVFDSNVMCVCSKTRLSKIKLKAVYFALIFSPIVKYTCISHDLIIGITCTPFAGYL